MALEVTEIPVSHVGEIITILSLDDETEWELELLQFFYKHSGLNIQIADGRRTIAINGFVGAIYFENIADLLQVNSDLLRMKYSNKGEKLFEKYSELFSQ